MPELDMFEYIKLPSKGVLYPENHPFHKKEEIKIRLLTALDEDLLTSKSLIQSGKLTDELVKEVVMDKTLDIDSLLIGDKHAILVYSRLFFLGTDYKAFATCKYCDQKDEYVFDIGNVPIKTLSVEPIEPFTNLFLYKTTKDNEIIFELPTVKLSKDVEKEIEMVQKVNKKHGRFNLKDNNYSVLYRYLIKSINGKSETKEINEELGKMPMFEAREFRKYMKNISPTIEFTSSFYCTNCGQTNEEVELDYNQNFFWDVF